MSFEVAMHHLRNPGSFAVLRQSDRSHPEYVSKVTRAPKNSQPIYRQVRDRVVVTILDGVLNEGHPLPRDKGNRL